ncbi:pyroglutamyl-peptidase 1-like protein isoform X2 [Psammomys obesus]|uniref:pyroglutamyl-peptidase 1-like protein isoform X2 n=1 Tax=Psammomys obesus TaxID=48139 RepID=UPI00245299FE|nr:pyroglutamyl-peptidase 1-like protein isoform X2 [Psammomys obesus]
MNTIKTYFPAYPGPWLPGDFGFCYQLTAAITVSHRSRTIFGKTQSSSMGLLLCLCQQADGDGRTGFGPFRQHLVNSSWEAVKELSKLGLGADTNLELGTLQLPVDYREVKRRLTTIWEDLQPQLAVHVGMDTSAKAIFLEQCGKNRGYRDSDVRGFQPEGGVCLPGGPEVMLSVVSMKEVSRYVCDYTYYLSLHLGNGHATLIHVPPLSHRLPASLLAKALRVIIQEMLEDSGEVQTQMAAA